MMPKSPAALFGLVGHYRNHQPRREPDFTEDIPLEELLGTAVSHTRRRVQRIAMWLTLLLLAIGVGAWLFLLRPASSDLVQPTNERQAVAISSVPQQASEIMNGERAVKTAVKSSANVMLKSSASSHQIVQLHAQFRATNHPPPKLTQQQCPRQSPKDLARSGTSGAIFFL